MEKINEQLIFEIMVKINKLIDISTIYDQRLIIIEETLYKMKDYIYKNDGVDL